MKFAGAQGITRSRVPLIAMLALAAMIGLAGCEGDDGKDGAAGTPGADGTDGANGLNCWDLNQNGIKDPEEDLNKDGVVDTKDCNGLIGGGGGGDPITSLKPEACAVCHGEAGAEHQAVYDAYLSPGTLGLAITSVAAAPEAGATTFTLTTTIEVTDNGAPFAGGEAGFLAFLQKTFYAVRYDAVADNFPENKSLPVNLASNDPAFNPADSPYIVEGPVGTFTLTTTGSAFDPTATDAVVYGYVARNELPGEVGGSIHLYDDLASAAWKNGAVDNYVSDANVAGCEKCHGAPYQKHGYRAAQVEGINDFVSCKVCHYDTRNGGHLEWQMMVDDPYTWATVPSANYTTEQKAKLAYKAKLMNDVHMSHVMEFPYPQNAVSCVTCHEGNLDSILADENFTSEVCRSCHAVDGKDSWEEDPVTGEPQKYYEEAGDGGRKRAPPLAYLWDKANVASFHGAAKPCGDCHKAGGAASQFSDYHTGYDPQIYDASGNRYTATKTVSIDSVTKTGNVVNIKFSASDTATVPMLAISFLGYDTKHMLVSSHTRAASPMCGSSGCRYEYTVGANNNALFVETATGVAGTWDVSIDLTNYIPDVETGLPTIAEMIADGRIKNMNVTLFPNLVIDDVEVTVAGALKYYDIAGTSAVETTVDGMGAEAIVDNARCNTCHDVLGTSFHRPDYGANGVQGCRNCHVTTNGGSHLEMQSRSIDSYVHAIHAFQFFDTADRRDPSASYDFSDPVFALRYDDHVEFFFPLFTKLACTGCHVDDAEKFGVPDQSKSMPGLLSASYYPLNGRDRSIGNIPEYVTGPAQRACGACHRSTAINEDNAGELAALNGHWAQNGYSIENTDATPDWVYQVIEKIMSLF